MKLSKLKQGDKFKFLTFTSQGIKPSSKINTKVANKGALIVYQTEEYLNVTKDQNIHAI